MDRDLESRSSSPSLKLPQYGSRKGSLRRLDRIFCDIIKYFPLLLVYSGTLWAVYTASWQICFKVIGGAGGKLMGVLGVVLYVLANWSYTYAVFVSPGSPLDDGGYSSLPTTEPAAARIVTVKSSGGSRFCKKCQCRKPDRTHHCSTCRKCVLKMDHHCPWLATCLGLHNYKAFIQFLIYTSFLCLYAFFISAAFVYTEIFATHTPTDSDDPPINALLLSVISGIIGLVLSGFTIWHLMLIKKGQTTIESLEKTRYVPPIPVGASFLSSSSEGQTQEQRQWANYVDSEVGTNLPHAFDLGAKQNFEEVFGPRTTWHLWFLPIKSTFQDGSNWKLGAKFLEASERAQHEREAALARYSMPGLANLPITRHPALGGGKKVAADAGHAPGRGRQARPSGGGRGKANRVLGRDGEFSDEGAEHVPMKRMKQTDEWGDMSSDGEMW